MTRHTPGPWHHSSTMLGKAYGVGAENNANICHVIGPHENGADEFKANARLIAAAPDLLATLKEVESYFDDRADADCDQDGYIPNAEMRLLVEITKAINKAEGRA